MSRSDPVIANPGPSSSFSLDSSGVAGFFGGDGAVYAMATVHLLPSRSWGGWYNSPGSYEIAKRYGQIANSRVWDGLFPGSKCEPAQLFELDGKEGPRRFLGAHSGTSLSPTGHLAYLLARTVQNIHPVKHLATTATPSTPIHVTVIQLRDTPKSKVYPFDNSQALPQPRTAPLRYSSFLAIFPIAASVGACVLCALVADWWAFASIALGMIAGGFASLVIGSGVLVFQHPNAAHSTPLGDGLLWEDKEIIVLLGPENAVNVFTRGSFALEFGAAAAGDTTSNESDESAESDHGAIGYCSVLLTAQFLVQLLLIPQATLFGQLMFVTSLGVSWVYNVYVSSFDREELQMNIVYRLMPGLEQDIANGSVERFVVPSWRTAVVLSLLLLQRNERIRNPWKPLDELLPNDTPVWREWKKKVVASWLKTGERYDDVEGNKDFTGPERELFKELFEDAERVYQDWKKLKGSTGADHTVASGLQQNPRGAAVPVTVATAIASAAATVASAAAVLNALAASLATA